MRKVTTISLYLKKLIRPSPAVNRYTGVSDDLRLPLVALLAVRLSASDESDA
jgi:hypothetical protein